MKCFTLILLISYTTSVACGQGSWDIGYIEVDSISSELAGLSVKIDFRHSNGKSKSTLKAVRSYVALQDSGVLSIDGHELEVIEKRKVYVDHGSFDDQYLQVVDQDSFVLRKIYDTRVIEVRDDSLKLQITVDSFDKQGKGRDRKIDSVVKEIWIERKRLDGLMKRN